MTEAVNLTLHCAKCGQLFTIALRPQAKRQPPDEPLPVTIPCPYQTCDGKMAPKLYADVLGVWAGNGPPATARMAKIDNVEPPRAPSAKATGTD